MALANQIDLTSEMRQTLLVWLSAVNSQFNFSLETWCLTVRSVASAHQPYDRAYIFKF